MLGKIGKWAGDRWGNGPSAKGLKSSVKGTTKLAAKVAPYAAGALALTGVGAPIAGAIGAGLKKIPLVGGLVGGGGADGKGNFGALGDLAGKKIPGVGSSASDLLGGAGGAGGDKLQQLLKLAGIAGVGAAGVKGWNDAGAAGKDRAAAMGRASAIADEQAGYGRDLIASQRPHRDASSAALLAKVNAGQRAPTDLSHLTDKANPFRPQFSPAVPPPISATARVTPDAAPPTASPMLPPPPKRKLLAAGAAR